MRLTLTWDVCYCFYWYKKWLTLTWDVLKSNKRDNSQTILKD